MKKFRDDICRIGKCVNVGVCLGLCPLVDNVNGKVKSKEVLLSNLVNSQNLEFRDYKAYISELYENQQAKNESVFERMSELTEGMEKIKFSEKRKIAGIVLLALRFSPKDIAKIFKLSLRRFYEVMK